MSSRTTGSHVFWVGKECFPTSSQTYSADDDGYNADLVLLSIRCLRGGEQGQQLVGKLYIAKHHTVYWKCGHGSDVSLNNDLDEIMECL